jgi:hypothetical protein
MTLTDIALYAGAVIALCGFIGALVAIAIWPEVFERDEH